MADADPTPPPSAGDPDLNAAKTGEMDQARRYAEGADAAVPAALDEDAGDPGRPADGGVERKGHGEGKDKDEFARTDRATRPIESDSGLNGAAQQQGGSALAGAMQTGTRGGER